VSAAEALQARDANLDGIVDGYYDPTQDLTFAADANLAAALGWPADSPTHSGALDWQTAMGFPSALDLFGTTGWRTPKALRFEPVGDDGAVYEWWPVESELSNLPTLAPFRNLQASYWLDGLVSCCGWNEGFATYFGTYLHRDGYTKEFGASMHVWAVHDGDVFGVQQGARMAAVAEIPEPSTYALILAGLALVWLRRPTPR
jgi:hypothetical protein